jgi:NAD(P)-dependent dehydrogenase (short-subunit alcohol dehydrogenase family)
VGTPILSQSGDVRIPSHLESLVQECRQAWGGLDLLVTAHGAAPVVRPSLHVNGTDLERVYESDVWGTLLACQVAAKAMMRGDGGAMVLLTSLHAFQSYPARAPYAAAKAAVVGMMRSLALEWGPLGIRVNAVAPWQTEGPRTSWFIAQAESRGEDLAEAYRAKSPLRRLIRPEEVADAVVFLARNPSMTGQCLVLDAGVSASMWMHPFADTTEGVVTLSQHANFSGLAGSERDDQVGGLWGYKGQG